jgi:PPOX class probable F420-dependent enzyme
MALLDRQNKKHAHALDRLREELVVWLTTVTTEGQPQSSPVWFLWDDDVFHVFSQPHRPKLRNISANPGLALHLEGGPEGEDVVVFEGTAKIDRDAPSATDLPDYIGKYRRQIGGYEWTPEGFAADYSVPVLITPTRVRVD